MSLFHQTKTFVIALLPAWLLTYVLACLFHTQRVVHGLVEVGVTVPFTDRLHISAYDIWGLLPAYGSAIAGALIISLLVVAVLFRWTGRSYLLAMLGAGVAMLVMLTAMQPIMGVTLIAGARETIGVVLQCAAGCAGGALFTYLYGRKSGT